MHQRPLHWCAVAILFFLNNRILILLKRIGALFLALHTFLVPHAWKAYVMDGAPAAILDNKVFLNMYTTTWIMEQKITRCLDLITMDHHGPPWAAYGLPFHERRIHPYVI